MPSTVDSRRIFAESVPVAGILLFWVVLSWAAPNSILETGLELAGILMALVHVGTRGLTLARTHSPAPSSATVSGVLRENFRALKPAAGWFVAAFAISVLEAYWTALGLPGLFTSPEESLSFVLTGTGVATVLLSGLIYGIPRLEGREE